MVQFSITMGQNSSLPKPGRRKSLRSFGRSSHRHNNLSHTFTINDSEDRIEQVNINLATEEMLMTLDGIGRDLARSIVEHRKAIGRFRKVEDLVLVLGADRLERIRPEICVSCRRSAGSASSRAQSYDSLKSTDSRLTVRSNRLVNVNKATVFELQCVHGITQEIAANIVHHREKKGPFKKVEELIKVKGVDRIRLDNISRALTLTDNADGSDVTPDQDSPGPAVLTNGHGPVFDRRLNGGPLKLGGGVANGLPLSSLIDIFELLSAYSPRPIMEETFDHSRNGEPALRVATWNLHGFAQDKAGNLGVKEVLCRTLLENGISILAVQDIVDVGALKIICDELNKPKLRRIEEWKDKHHNWNFCMLDIENAHLGFIYDSDGAYDIELMSLTQGPEDTIGQCEVLIARFRINNLDLQLVNMRLNKKAEQDSLHHKIKDLLSEEELVLLFLTFPESSKGSDEWCNIGGLNPVLPPNTNTNYSVSKSESSSTHHTNNILYNSKIRGQLTGVSGVVRQGLTHLAIPNGWNWGGPVSRYCPIWTEIFLNSNSGTAL